MEKTAKHYYTLKVLEAIAKAYPQAAQNAVLPREEGQDLQDILQRLKLRKWITTKEITYLNGQYEILEAKITPVGFEILKQNPS